MFRSLHKKKKGFSMVEVTVAATIFTLTTLGVLSTISVLRKPAKVSQTRLQAAYWGQQILEDLRAQIDQETWNASNSLLSVDEHTLTNGIYTATYVVTEDVSTGGRSVTLTIDYPETNEDP